MVRDYGAAGLPRGPLRFAENYYLHYPKVALGHWPPGFYLLQTAWTMVFSPSRVSILLLMAALASGKFLDQPRWREAMVFSVLAVLAIMTHGKTLALALLPGFAILIGQQHLVRSPVPPALCRRQRGGGLPGEHPGRAGGAGHR